MLPPRRILAAVDSSPGSRTALIFAGLLARQCGAALHVVHAVAPLLTGDRDTATRRQDLREQLQRTHTGLETVSDPAFFHIVEGKAGDVIVHVAAREQADLIVLGIRAAHNEEATPGMTLTRVLEHAAVPVLAVPETWSPPDSGHDDLRGVGPVIAALNVTCPAIEGASAACRLGAILGTSVVLLHAVTPSETAAARPSTGTSTTAAVLDAAAQDVALVVSALRAQSPVPVELVIETGDAFSVLAAAAAQHPHALIVLGRSVGTHDYGPPCSIATHLLRSARVPVLVYVCR